MARKNPAMKNSKNFLPGLVSSRQNVQIPRQNEPKCVNSSPGCLLFLEIGDGARPEVFLSECIIAVNPIQTIISKT